MVKNLEKSEQYLRDFFDNAPFGFHVFGADKVIIDMNKTELDLLGYDYEEVIGKKKWTDLICDNQKKLFEKHWKIIIDKGVVKNFQYTLKRKDGSFLYVLLYATARFDDSGELMNTRGVVIDVTQAREIEKSLEYVKQQIKNQEDVFQEKNSALSDVLSRNEVEKNKFSHNVSNNIETVILPLVRKLKRRGSPLDRKNIELLESSIKQMMGSFGSSLVQIENKLTAREMEVCNMVKNGFKTKNIAETLNVSLRTVDNHRNNIRKKLDISKKKLQLAAYLKAMADG